MVKEILFHLGDCKTGTTAIQSVLAGGHIQSDLSICYPTKFNHIPVARALSVKSEMHKEGRLFRRLRQALTSSEADIGVISAEHFEFVQPEVIRRAIDTYLGEYADQIRLVAYVRPHADRLVSAFAERSKQGVFQSSLEKMHERLLKDRLLFYAPRFKRMRELFGDQFILRPFIRDDLLEGDVVKDFLNLLFRGEAFSLAGDRQMNESLSVQDIAMMRYLHKRINVHADPDEDLRREKQSLGWYLADILAALPSEEGIKPRLHSSLAEKVVETYAEDAANLDAEFFEGTPLTDALASAPQKAIAEEQLFDAELYFSKAELRQVEAWSKMMTRMMQAGPEYFNWSVRPEEQRAVKAPTLNKKAPKPAEVVEPPAALPEASVVDQVAAGEPVEDQDAPEVEQVEALEDRKTA